jgi:hypothetical protein
MRPSYSLAGAPAQLFLGFQKKDALTFCTQWHLGEAKAEKVIPRNRIHDVKIISEAHFSIE